MLWQHSGVDMSTHQSERYAVFSIRNGNCPVLVESFSSYMQAAKSGLNSNRIAIDLETLEGIEPSKPGYKLVKLKNKKQITNQKKEEL